MSLRKFLFPLLLLLPAACATPQKEATFQSFLEGFKECNRMEFSFYKGSVFVHNPHINDSLYARFIPPQNEDKAISSVSWYKGCCMKHGDITVALLGKWCYDYGDKFNRLFVEYEACFYVLVVYSAKGEILDHKTICHWGGGSYGTTYFARITPTGDPLTFRVEQATLDGDGKLMEQYKEDLIYTVTTHEYTISPNGKINDKPLGTTKEHRRPEGADSHTIKSFEQFKSFFIKCEKPYVLDSLFKRKRNSDDWVSKYLPVPDCYDFIPDTILSGGAPRDVYFAPCRYIAAGGRFYFFVIEFCDTPENAYPYGDYKILEFDGKGRFKRQYLVLHDSDNHYIRKVDLPFMLRPRLKKYEKLWGTSR